MQLFNLVLYPQNVRSVTLRWISYTRQISAITALLPGSLVVSSYTHQDFRKFRTHMLFLHCQLADCMAVVASSPPKQPWSFHSLWKCLFYFDICMFWHIHWNTVRLHMSSVESMKPQWIPDAGWRMPIGIWWINLEVNSFFLDGAN